jgi:hypothetical protein
MYITNDRPNVSGLVLSGSADFKTELSQSDMFDPRLQAIVLGVVDVSYGACGLVWRLALQTSIVSVGSLPFACLRPSCWESSTSATVRFSYCMMYCDCLHSCPG